jgi:hypothetical protein
VPSRLAAIHHAKEYSMDNETSVAWLTLNTRYYAAPVGNPLTLLEDSQTLLKSAHAMALILREFILLRPNTDQECLMLALQAVEILMQMSAGSTRVANARFLEIGDPWVTGEREE